MTIQDLARDLGVSSRVARRRAQRLGIQIQDRRSYVRLSYADQEALRASLTNQHTPSRGDDRCRLPDTPGLPLELLGDPNYRDAFTRMRFEREYRLHRLLSSVVTS